MQHQIAWLATVTILGVLEQAYFALQVISVRRKRKVSPPLTLGPPEFERIFRAQTNCSEYFPIFVSLLWVAGIFSHQVLAAFCGLLYLYARYSYFTGYARSAEERITMETRYVMRMANYLSLLEDPAYRLAPMYFSAGVLCILIVLSVFGLTIHFVSLLHF